MAASHIALTKGTIKYYAGMLKRPATDAQRAEYADKLAVLDRCLAEDESLLVELKSKIADAGKGL